MWNISYFIVVAFAVACVMLSLRDHGTFRPSTTELNNTTVNDLVLTKDDATAAIVPDETLLVAGWVPSLMHAQIAYVIEVLGFKGNIVVLCPTAADREDVHRLFPTPSVVSAFFFPLETRLDMLNGKYLFLSSRAYVERLIPTLNNPQTHRVIAIDAHRVLWCGDIFSSLHETRNGLVFVGVPAERGSLIWKRSVQAQVYLNRPTFLADKPPQSLLRSVGAATKTQFVVFSNVVGGNVSVVAAFLDKICRILYNVPAGLAFEPVLTTTVGRFQHHGISWLPSRTLGDEPCYGAGGYNAQMQICLSNRSGGATVQLPLVVLQVAHCLPMDATPNSSFVVNDKGNGSIARHCRTMWETKRTMQLPYVKRKRFSLYTPLAAQRLWRNFTYKTQDKSRECAAKYDVVLGVATGYTPAKLRLFIETFLMSHRANRTKLVLFVLDTAAFSAAYGHEPDIIIINPEPLNVGRLGKCHIVLSRLEMMLTFLRSTTLNTVQCAERFLVVDTRDSVFQADPFDALDRLKEEETTSGSWPRHTNDFLLVPMERFLLGEEDFFSTLSYRLNRWWVMKTFGPKFYFNLAHSPLTGNHSTSDGLTFPILCGGLYMGSAAAIVDFFDVFVQTAMALGGCAVNDQGLLIGLVAVGLGESRFPHPVLLTDPYTTAFTNGPRGGQEIAWDNSGRVVNCRGEPYAILHQFDRYKALWRNLVARNSGPPF